MTSRLLLPLVLLVTLGGCSWFGGDEEDLAEPVELTRITPELELKTLWSKRVGKGAEDRAIRLVPAFNGSRIFAASADGKIAALNASDGRTIWEVKARSFYSKEEARNSFTDDVDVITGGVGIGSDIVVVGTAAGEILAVNQSDGSLVFRAKTSSEVLAPPQVDGDLVFAQTIDGKVAAYDALDGKRRWVYSTTVPSLTLRGTSTPIASSDFIIAAFANGRFVLLDRERGIAGADERVSVAKGRSDLERLIDIDGTMVVAQQTLFVVGFQGRLAAINLINGRVNWSRDASSIVGLGAGFGNVYLAEANSALSGIDMSNGRDVWRIESLLYREITTPVASGSYIVVCDFEGYMHVIAQSDGRFVARKRVDSDGVLSPVVADGNRLYVIGKSGRLVALELQ